MPATNVVSFTSPLAPAGVTTSGAIQVTRAESITGTIYADVAGVAYVDQGGDGSNWDFTTAYAVGPGAQTGGTIIDEPVISQYFQIRYINGSSQQTIFRLYANPRDPYGAFLATAQAPSSGGAYGVLVWSQAAANYTFMGRFDGVDEYNAITNAALVNGANGKYAAFLVANAIVSDETIQKTTEHSPDSF